MGQGRSSERSLTGLPLQHKEILDLVQEKTGDDEATEGGKKNTTKGKENADKRNRLRPRQRKRGKGRTERVQRKKKSARTLQRETWKGRARDRKGKGPTPPQRGKKVVSEGKRQVVTRMREKRGEGRKNRNSKKEDPGVKRRKAEKPFHLRERGTRQGQDLWEMPKRKKTWKKGGHASVSSSERR